MKPFFSALRTWLKSWRFIFENGLTHFFLYPILISVLLSMGSAVFINYCVSHAMDFINPYFEFTPLNGTFWQNVLTFFSGVGHYALAFVISLFMYYLFFRVQKYIVLALMSPIMALLSARADSILTGIDIPFNSLQFFKDVFRGILLVARNFLMEMFLTLLLWCAAIYLAILMPVSVLFFMPIVSLASFFIGAYFFGFSIIDYHNERRKLSIRQSILFVRKNKETAVGLGAVFAILFRFPFIGVAIGTITCTVAGMLAICEKNKADYSKS